MFDYGHCHRSAFIESKCNFRLALMYYKSFLFSPWAQINSVPFTEHRPMKLAVIEHVVVAHDVYSTEEQVAR